MNYNHVSQLQGAPLHIQLVSYTNKTFTILTSIILFRGRSSYAYKHALLTQTLPIFFDNFISTVVKESSFFSRFSYSTVEAQGQFSHTTTVRHMKEGSQCTFLAQAADKSDRAQRESISDILHTRMFYWCIQCWAMHQHNASRRGNHPKSRGHLTNPISQKTHQRRQNEGISHKIRQSESLSRLSDPLREEMLPQFQCGRLKLHRKGRYG